MGGSIFDADSFAQGSLLHAELHAQTIDDHREGILAYFDFPIPNVPLEETDNKIKMLQKQAYGFRDLEFFKLKFYALHETRYALIG